MKLKKKNNKETFSLELFAHKKKDSKLQVLSFWFRKKNEYLNNDIKIKKVLKQKFIEFEFKKPKNIIKLSQLIRFINGCGFKDGIMFRKKEFNFTY